MPRRDRVSQTALKVARGVASMGSIPELAELLPPGAAESTTALLRAAGLLPAWQQTLVSKTPVAQGAVFLDRVWLGGIARAGALRKHFIEDETRAGIEAGAQQVLLVGAGFDTLALRLGPRHFETRFVELDHPPTHRIKREAVVRLGDAVPNLSFASADLSVDPLDRVLDELAVWRTDAPSVVVAEGVLMYLARDEVRSFFQRVRRSTGPNSRIVFTHVGVDPRGRPTLGALGGLGWTTQSALKLLGEPLRWGIAAEDLNRFVRPMGFAIDPSTRTDLRRRYLVPLGRSTEPVSRAERMAVALRR